MRKAVRNMFAWLREPRFGRTPGREQPARKPAAPNDPPAIYHRLGIPATLHHPDTSLAQMFEQTAKRFAAAPAIVYQDWSATYGELRSTVNRLAGGLAKLGVGPGDRVVMTLPNCPEYIESYFAIQKLGAVLVNAGPLMGKDDLAALIAKTEARMVIGLDLHAPIACAAGNGRASAGDIAYIWVSLKEYQSVITRMGYRIKLWQQDQSACALARQHRYHDVLADAPPCPPTIASDPGATAMLQPTGGTTGTLKVAELTHRNLLANATQLSAWVPMRPGQERVLAVLPMFHVYGMSTCLTTSVFNGACMYPLTRFRVTQVLDTIVQHRPTIVPLVPAIIQAICDELEARPRAAVAEAVRNRHVISGAAPLPPIVGERFEQLTGLRIVQGYGLTECSPVTHANPPAEPRGGSIGIPLPDTTTRIVDLADPTKDVEPGKPGELWISGPQVMTGYYDEPEQTANIISADANGRRWLHTGDIARVDEDGYYYILDRKKDMINRGGLKVYPAKVERVVMMHPLVRDVAVIGESDAKYTEQVVAKVALKDHVKAERSLAGELKSLCREHLSPYETPMRFDFVDELPRSALGKMLKYQLRDVPVDAEGEPVDKPTPTKEPA